MSVLAEPNGKTRPRNMAPESRKTLPRADRLLRHADFKRVYDRGRRHFARHMTVFYLVRAEAEPQGCRIGFTVSRALGGAVVRNRMRRRLREAVRLVARDGMAQVDIVINPKKSLLTAEFSDIQREVHQAFEAVARNCGLHP